MTWKNGSYAQVQPTSNISYLSFNFLYILFRKLNFSKILKILEKF